MRKIIRDEKCGLLTDESTDPPTLIGYVWMPAGHGAYDPCGKIDLPLTQDQVGAHNRTLAKIERDAILNAGRGILYWDGKYVSQWTGELKIVAHHVKHSFHNFAGKDGRTDVWFTFGGAVWHGVQIGGNNMLRVKRLKGGVHA